MAQLVRAPPCHGGGREFESHLGRLHYLGSATIDNFILWGLSSAGRASALQAEGHRFEPYRPHRNYGWIPEWPKGADCKSVGTAFEGSNPSPPTKLMIFITYKPSKGASRCGSIGRAADL